MASPAQASQRPKGRGKISLLVLLIVLAVIVLTAFLTHRRGVIPVRVAVASRTTITSAIATNGKIEPELNFEAHAPAPTTIRRVLVKEGDKIHKGQLLLQLDDSQARSDAARALAQVRAAQADLSAIEHGGTREEVLTTESQLQQGQAELQAAQTSLETLKRLQQSGAASPGEVADAEARVRNAQNQVNLLKQKQTGRFSTPERERVQAELTQAQAAYSAAEDLLAKSNIVSPLDGTVYNLPVKTGVYVNSGDLLVQAADLSKVIVRAFVDEPDIGRLSRGEQVAITWDALPGRTWSGTVTQVPTTVTMRGSRTVGEVTSVVDNSDRELLPNVNVSVTITTAKHENTLTLPREAVHQDDGRRYVYEVVGGSLEKRYIETGISNLTRIEVTSGIKDGQMIALGSMNGRSLGEGTAVKAVD